MGTASRNTVFEALDGLETDDGIAAYTALEQALDVAGAGDAKAWKSGPDEILYVTVNMPTTGEVTEADVVAAAIGLKARAAHGADPHRRHPLPPVRDVPADSPP